MKPITFTCSATFSVSPTQIGERVLDVNNWTDFTGYGPVPGIKSAEFEDRTPNVVGSKIRVHNTDGSTHIEQITEWNPAGGSIRMEMQDFSAPLSRLAEKFDESWSFDVKGETTHVHRRFELHPRSAFTRPFLWCISRLLRRAVNRHMNRMGQA